MIEITIIRGRRDRVFEETLRMRRRLSELLFVGCLLASGCAIAPRWPSTISDLLVPVQTERSKQTSRLIDAWDEDDDELRPYELAPLKAVQATEVDAVAPTANQDEPAESSTSIDVEPVEPETVDAVIVEQGAVEQGSFEDSRSESPEPEQREAQLPTQKIDDAYLDTIERPYSAAAQFIEPPQGPAAPPLPESIDTPAAAERSRFRYGDGEDDLDRFNRRLEDIPLDARPIEGTMPTPPAIAEHPDRPRWVDAEEGLPLTVVSCSPWTLCFRPLYYEEINLERYGRTAGLVQPALSGAHFFGSVALMPYKFVVWPPRSCVCSNGFSRCTDCRPPGYRECVWSWTAAAVEAGVVAGIVLALP
jgi:hypothetical protein